jgi:hypothetical protein
MHLQATLFLSLCAFHCQEPAPAAPALPAPDAGVTRAELEQHVRFLASDELAGRAPLTSGMERAAEYLAEALASFGCEPAGEDGSFFQDTGRRRLSYPKKPALRFQRDDGVVVEAQLGLDFTLRPRGLARSTGRLPLQFFYDYNHARMPLTGNAAEALYFSGSKPDKQRILAEKGITSLSDWGLELELMPGEKGREPGEPKEQPERISEGAETEGCELVELRGPLLVDFERRRFTHVELVAEEVSAPFHDRNVVARIRGAGTSAQPELAEEVVLLSAHYDHLGIKKSPKKERTDDVYNGADDDASGCAALLELAQAFARGPQPARTLVFLFTTGEESGGHGSRRYIAAPAAPLARTVANLNLEMLGRPDELAGGAGKLWLTGFQRTNLGSEFAAKGLAIVADPHPQENFFSRSDNYAFALEGVVAQTLSSFALHAEYHTARDEADTLDYAHLEGATKLALEAMRLLADGSLRPAWNEGKMPEKRTGATGAPRTEEQEAAEREKRRVEREQFKGRRGKQDEDEGGEPK